MIVTESGKKYPAVGQVADPHLFPARSQIRAEPLLNPTRETSS